MKQLVLTMVVASFSLPSWADNLDPDPSKQNHGAEAARSALKVAMQDAELLPTPVGVGGELSFFGTSVSFDGDRALVGAPRASASGAAYVFELAESTWVLTDILVPDDAADLDRFGHSVSLSGDRALVGAYSTDDNGEDSGSAYVFDFAVDEWVETQELTASDAAAGDEFGYSVSLLGDRALIGARYADGSATQSGSAYVFELQGGIWTETTSLNAMDGLANDEFGYSVSLGTDRAVVGAALDDDPTAGVRAGSAYVFDLSVGTWSETQKLVASDAGASDYFGISVSLSGDRLLIGSQFDDDNGSNSGSAYVFDFVSDTWMESEKLIAGDGADSDRFGFSVSLSGDRAVIGAYRHDDVINGLSDAGAAYVFEFNGAAWSQTTKLLASDPAMSAEFGYAVAISGNRVFVGADRASDRGPFSGAVYVFDYDSVNWVEQAKLLSDDSAAGDGFGVAVSLDGDRALVGAHQDNGDGINSGSAYIFDRAGDQWVLSAKLTASDAGAGDLFGVSVSLLGDRAVVGADREEVNSSDEGAVYVYEFDGTTWSETTKLKPDLVQSNAQFGISVSLGSDRLLVGAQRADAERGAAYVFEYDGNVWTQAAKLTASDGASGDQFGRAVSLWGDRALIGAPFDDDFGPNSGSAYVFDFNGTWSQTDKFSFGDSNDNFGSSVSLSGDQALVGAPFDDAPENASGAAYLYVLNGTSWTFSDQLTASNGAASNYFGISVSLSDNRALVGAWGGEGAEAFSGAAYVFNIAGGIANQIELLSSLGGRSFERFGDSVSLSGDRYLIGATRTDSAGLQSGSAFVLTQTPLLFRDRFEGN